MIHYADTPKKLMHCLPAIQSLRPHINEKNIMRYIEQMEKENYQVIYVEENGKAVAFSGFRYITHLFTEKIIYIDDLGTIEEYQGKGYGSLLLDHIIQLAKEKGLYGVRLDSGHHRYDAHRLYLNKGFHIVSHHFSLKFRDPD